uniref:4'-phosphopantetheinyl transferase N-terminal domain-containing protein n=1 Tax=Ditylum brightwellii TaxID=49249 RepID=A0A7S4VUS3_9STRA|mmetsp:Transcript_37870/g.57634  ORF Transcript_37870/g.57634 Transcript_37870/m.57634 type:complete len:316 (-) Transcript_37870:386-1333(-)
MTDVTQQCDCKRSQTNRTKKRNARNQKGLDPTLLLLLCHVLLVTSQAMRSASIVRGISTSFPEGMRSAFVCVRRSTSAHSKSCSLSTTATATDPTANTCKGKAQSSIDAHYQHLFSLALPEGQCVGLRLCTNASPPAWISDVLHPKEVAYAMNLPSQTSQDTFFVGRLAMRHALLASHTSSFAALPAVSADDAAILKDEHGRPTMPKGVLGSITHKKKTGVALVSSASTRRRGVGVDLEQTCTGRRSIARRILTEGEILNLGCVEVCLLFCAFFVPFLCSMYFKAYQQIIMCIYSLSFTLTRVLPKKKKYFFDLA